MIRLSVTPFTAPYWGAVRGFDHPRAGAAPVAPPLAALAAGAANRREQARRAGGGTESHECGWCD